ncbi:MAG: hypothetical protein ACI875_000813, partial [Planctomycetota bacterium]
MTIEQHRKFLQISTTQKFGAEQYARPQIFEIIYCLF